jgi:hypothetical protein
VEVIGDVVERPEIVVGGRQRDVVVHVDAFGPTADIEAGIFGADQSGQRKAFESAEDAAAAQAAAAAAIAAADFPAARVGSAGRLTTIAGEGDSAHAWVVRPAAGLGEHWTRAERQCGDPDFPCPNLHC